MVSRVSDWMSTGIAVLVLGASAYIAYTSKSSLELTQQTQRLILFGQFQQEYTTIATNFPSQLFDPSFRPARGSSDYKRLEDYWIFCYAQWFATNKTNPPILRDLWASYYSELVTNALRTPALRYVLTDMSQTYGAPGGTVHEFYDAMRELSRKAGIPLGAGSTNHTGTR